MWNDDKGEERGGNAPPRVWARVGGMACKDKTVHTGCFLKRRRRLTGLEIGVYTGCLSGAIEAGTTGGVKFIPVAPSWITVLRALGRNDLS